VLEEKLAVKIRLARHGTTNRPYYRVVAADCSSPRDGRYIELLGTYDPVPDPAHVTLKMDRIEYWLSVGAKPTDTVNSLVKNYGAEPVVEESAVEDPAAEEAVAEETVVEETVAEETVVEETVVEETGADEQVLVEENDERTD